MDVCCTCYERQELARLELALAEGRYAFTPPEVEQIERLRDELGVRLANVHRYFAHLDESLPAACHPHPVEGATP